MAEKSLSHHTPEPSGTTQNVSGSPIGSAFTGLSLSITKKAVPIVRVL